MSMIFMGPFELLTIMLLGGGVGLPLGMPPGPEDPVLSRIAPAECLFYLSWSGMAAPDPASKNQTEQLLAEPEVRRFISELDERITDSLRRETKNDRQAEAVIDEVHKVVIAVLTSPTAMYVSKLDVAGREPNVRGGALVNLGDRAAEIKEALAKIETIAQGAEGAKPAAEEAKWHTIPLPDGQALQWAVKNKYLILGLGEGEADAIYGRASQEPPAWLADARKKLTVERTASVTYLNVGAILKMAAPAMGREGAAVLEALGLGKVQYVASVTGLEGPDCVTRTLVAVDGQPSGVLSIFSAEPLTKEHLAAIPADATLAAAARFDLAKAYQRFLEIAGRIDPRAREELSGGMGMIEEKVGFSIAKDVFEAVGEVWRVYNSPGEGGLVVTGLTAVVDLRDRDKLIKANAKLVLAAMAAGAAGSVTGEGRFRRDPRILQFKHGQNTVFFLSVPDAEFPFAPAWCITDKQLVVALFPQNVKAFLDRAPGAKTLADDPAAAAAFDGGQGPMALGYTNTPELFKLVYPIVNIFAQMICGQLQREGIDVDVSILPSAASILPHLRPSTTKVVKTPAGVMVESRTTLPMSGGLVMGWTAPFWLFARPSGPIRLESLPTPQNQSANNLKQILLAFHNYHATFNGFPAASGPRKEGQPPVSWRVLILPYIEQQALYEQYRFDEAWDSENNKRLLDKMPDVFRAPGSKAAAKGMTNYLAVVGEGYALSPAKPTRLAEFTDGTSNTIMVVEAADAKAVPWTRPADFTPDKKDPAAGLVGLRTGGFMAALADGSVHFISSSLGADTLNALFTRSGGEAVDWDWREGSAGRPVPVRKTAPKAIFEERPAIEKEKPAPEEEAVPEKPRFEKETPPKVLERARP